jgi:outer membrane immunogenic protein
MKRFFVTVMLSIVGVSHAIAADFPQPMTPEVPAAYLPGTAPVYNWGGIYFGLNGGYAFGRSSWSGAGLATGDFSTSGGLVGGTLGVNYQTEEFVFGLETDVDWTGITGSVSNCSFTSENCTTSNDWLGTTRARVGYAADRVLFYGTGGVAYGNVQANGNGSTNSSTKAGWTAGAGVEAAFADNWTARIEYLYVDLGSASCGATCGNAPVSVSFTQNLVRAGVDFKFR